MRKLLLAVPLVIAACGGSGGTQGGTSAGGDATAAPGAPAATGAQAASGPAFAELIRGGKLTTYKVTYKMTGSGPGPDASGSFEQTWYFKPPNTRLDFAGDDGYGGKAKISMFFLANGSFMCTEDGSQKTCLQMPQGAGGSQAAGLELQKSFQSDPGAFNATSRESRTIAGQRAFCYLVKGAAVGFAEGTFCYTQTGIPLFSEWSATGAKVTMEATAFSTSVPDSDFQLPVPATKFP